MNAGTLLLCAALCAAFGSAAFVLLCMRTALQQRGMKPSPQLPPLFRICRIPSLLLAPLVGLLLPPRAAHRIVRTLDALDLHPAVTAVHWISLRVLQGMAVATVVLVIAGPGAWLAVTLAGLAGFMYGNLWLRQRLKARELQIARELPAYLDLLTVCVEAGATLTAGVRLIVAQAPESPLRSFFDRVLREVRGGRPRAQAFLHVADVHGVDSLVTLANALSHAESAGMSLGQVLRNQSAQRTAERFARAERLAMQAPVKMLGPLILCIFPCTFIVLAVPIVVRMLEAFRS